MIRNGRRGAAGMAVSWPPPLSAALAVPAAVTRHVSDPDGGEQRLMISSASVFATW